MKAPRFMTRPAGSAKLLIGNKGPTILTYAGVAGFIATTALTIKATVKASDELPKIAHDFEVGRDGEGLDETNHEKTQRLVKVYGEAGLKVARIYGPTIVVGSASVACVLAGHGIMLKRQAGLVAAYTALDAGYRAYRGRVVERLGKDEELQLYRGVKTKEVYDDETGQVCEIVDPANIPPSPYARFFDESSRNWTKTAEYNLLFLRSQQDWANDRLRAYGYVFLNEVYEALGLERSQAGQIVGWKQNGNGDGFVDFGLYAIGDEGDRAFVNLIEPVVLLDFNVDGPIRI